ncbi:MAG: acyl-CoA mutase large subunit family protein [Bacteroidales bacterium]|nr:acyl-CoA mutase large subunit family protein [Bacteroidales bacterium]MCF8389091.1 acyl-CoA mutase large subunit family protein [Bacteroidales bacterium]
MAKYEKIFNEFTPSSKKEWEEIIHSDLKGAPYNKLITKTIEGIDLKPYYSKEDVSGLEYLNVLPNEFPFVRSSKIHLNEWEIQQDIFVKDVREANKNALHALGKGASAIKFIIAEEVILNEINFQALMDGIIFDCIQLSFNAPGKEDLILNLLLHETTKRDLDKKKINGCLNTDPIGELSKKGSKESDISIDFKNLATLIQTSAKIFPALRCLSLNGSIYHNGGSSAIQELALSLSKMVEYIDQLTENVLNIDEIAPHFQFNFSAGSSYFMEIAKIRAARVLYANIIKAYEAKNTDSQKVFIHTTTSEWNQTIYDPYINLLRGTTESMSAILGGTNSLSVSPFDKSFRETTRFSERLARNTQIILKEEAHLDKVVDPASGSWYVESLTHSIAEKAWELFLTIEEKGGYLAALKSNYIQTLIAETAEIRNTNIATRREVLLGTNQYANSKEQHSSDIKTDKVFPKITDLESLPIKPIPEYRGSQSFEELRLSTEISGKTPLVFLFNYGNLVWRKARAGFASEFFACAGYTIVDNSGFSDVNEGLRELRKCDADIVVLCSSDDEYPQITAAVLAELKEDQIPVIAGYPKDSIDELKSMGIEHFIHVKSNLFEELKKFNQLLGIV